MATFELMVEDDYGYWSKDSSHKTYNEAFKKACELYDSGKEAGDFSIIEIGEEGNFDRVIHGYQLMKELCPICGLESRAIDMVMSRDCHGIPFRRVCGGCWTDIVCRKGYDGERYDEADECIDPEW